MVTAVNGQHHWLEIDLRLHELSNQPSALIHCMYIAVCNVYSCIVLSICNMS
jgi:hypothetical protein